MDITWLGYSCFRIKGKHITLLTDPYPPDLGYPPGKNSANIVTVSHQHPNHSYTAGIDGSPRIIRGPGEYETGGVLILGVATFHDGESGALRGKNTVYFMEIDDISVCHLGDLGHPLTTAQVAELGNVDVLLVPVGGVSTIDAPAAAALVRQLDPKVVVPMHFKTPEIKQELDPVDRFLKEVGMNEVAPQPKLTITRTNIGEGTRTVLLDYHR